MSGSTGPPAGQCRRRRPASRSRGASGRRSEPVGEHVADALEHPAQLLGDRQVGRRQRRLDELIEHRRHQLGPAAVSTVDGRPRDARAGSDRVRPRRGDGTAQRGKRCKLTGSGAVGRMIAAAGWCAPAPGDPRDGRKSSALVLWALPSTRCREHSSAPVCANTGQTCCISSRILAPAERYDEVVIMVTTRSPPRSRATPSKEDTIFGPVATRSQLDTVMGHVDSGHAEEAAPPLVDVRPTFPWTTCWDPPSSPGSP